MEINAKEALECARGVGDCPACGHGDWIIGDYPMHVRITCEGCKNEWIFNQGTHITLTVIRSQRKHEG